MSNDSIRENPRFKEYFLVYMDLLGSKDRILNYTDPDDWNTDLGYLHSVYQLYKKAIEYKNEIYERYRPRGLQTKIFSDNIVIAAEVPDTEEEMKNTLIFLSYVASRFQTYALYLDGWLVRGCLTCGKLYLHENPSFIWGEGLVRAYNIETHVAIYPRVVIDNRIVGATGKTLRDLLNDDGVISKNIICGEDDVCYLNYFNIITNSYTYDEKESLSTESGAQLSMLEQEYQDNPEVLLKIKWTKNLWIKYWDV